MLLSDLGDELPVGGCWGANSTSTDFRAVHSAFECDSNISETTAECRDGRAFTELRSNYAQILVADENQGQSSSQLEPSDSPGYAVP